MTNMAKVSVIYYLNTSHVLMEIRLVWRTMNNDGMYVRFYGWGIACCRNSMLGSGNSSTLFDDSLHTLRPSCVGFSKALFCCIQT